MLISCAVTAQLICTFVFAYADCWFSHAVAQFKFFFSLAIGEILRTEIWASCMNFNQADPSVSIFSYAFIV